MKLTISQKLIAMITGSIGALLVVGVMGYFTVSQTLEHLEYTHDNILTNLNLLSRSEAEFLLIRVNALYFLSYDDPAKRIPHEQAIHQKIEEIQQLFRAYEKNTTNAQDKTLLESNKKLLTDYAAILDRLQDKVKNNDREAANNIVENEWKPAGSKLATAFQEHTKFNQNQAEKLVKSAVETGQRNNILTMLAGAIGIVLTGGIGLMLRQGILCSLRTMRETMLHVAGKLDLTVRVNVAEHDEIGETAIAFNQLLDRMQDNIRSVASTAAQVAQAAGQMAQTSAQVASASIQQSEAASNMASSIEQMSVSISQVGDRASETHKLSSESGKLAGEGEKVISHTVQEINQASETVEHAAERIRTLEKQSEQISSVVAVIKEVADQTNLLALNAAIEAARAGEQGRGFAVVADEVRKLAERTAASTQEITQTIESMREGARDAVAGMHHVVEQVNNSVAQASSAEQVMAKIGQDSRGSVAMVDEIVSAIREQTHASNSVAQQIEHIAQMAEEGSCAASESAQSARELDRLSNGMQQIVSAYTL